MLRRFVRVVPIIATLLLSIVPTVLGNVRALRFIAIVSTALTMEMTFAHTLELPGKMTYDGKLWWHLSRTLYRPWWGRAGYVEGVALCFPRQHPRRLGRRALCRSRPTRAPSLPLPSPSWPRLNRHP